MKNKALAIMVASGCLFVGSVNAAVNTGTSMSAQGAAEFTAASITAHSIADTAPISAGLQSTGYQLVGTGTVTTSFVGTYVALKPGAGFANPNLGYVPSRDLLVPGATSPTTSIVLSISTSASTNGVPPQATGNSAWSYIQPSSISSNQVTYYIVMPGGQNIPADTYSYTIDAATYSL